MFFLSYQNMKQTFILFSIKFEINVTSSTQKKKIEMKVKFSHNFITWNEHWFPYYEKMDSQNALNANYYFHKTILHI